MNDPNSRLREEMAKWDRQDRVMNVFWAVLFVWILTIFTYLILTGGPR